MFFDPGKNSKKLMLFEDNSSLTKSIELKLLSCIKDNRQKEMYFSMNRTHLGLMKKLTKMGYLNTTILHNNRGSKCYRTSDNMANYGICNKL